MSTTTEIINANTIPSDDEKLRMAEDNIRAALYDYARHVRSMDWDPDEVAGKFVNRLASDNLESKAELRELFRKSPAWNEALDCLVINGNRTHDPDPMKCANLTAQIVESSARSDVNTYMLRRFAYHLAAGSVEGGINDGTFRSLMEQFPKAYSSGKKPSRVMSAIFKGLGIVDNSAGSEYQKLFAQLADELNGKQIPFKLFVSLNPAHFLTMSNPKNDSRGSTLTSCHSLNSTDYPYNNGCTGYARDKYSIIVFTAADPNEPETLNNRKTSRQMFFYRPGSGVLLQSRMYGTSGGIDGATAEGDLYRDLIQREISELENTPNMWKTVEAVGNRFGIRFYSGEGFGGYCDWTYDYMRPMLSIRSDAMSIVERGGFKPWEIGTYGLCPYCGKEHSENFLCDECGGSCVKCECCGDSVDEDDMTWVYYGNGDEIQVCRYCLERYYAYCERCEEYHPIDDMHTVVTEWGEETWCDYCTDHYAEWCENCETYTDRDMFDAINEYGYSSRICRECMENYYTECEVCGKIVHNSLVELADDGEDGSVWACDKCYDTCDECGEIYVKSVLNYREAINGRNRCTCAACTEQVENREFEYTEGEVIA